MVAPRDEFVLRLSHHMVAHAMSSFSRQPPPHSALRDRFRRVHSSVIRLPARRIRRHTLPSAGCTVEEFVVFTLSRPSCPGHEFVVCTPLTPGCPNVEPVRYHAFPEVALETRAFADFGFPSCEAHSTTQFPR